MNFQDKVIKTRDDILKSSEYFSAIDSLRTRATQNVLEDKVEQALRSENNQVER